MKLVPGLYEQIVTSDLARLLQSSDGVPHLDALHDDAAADLLARHVYETVRRALGDIKAKDRLGAQVAATNAVLTHLATAHGEAVSAADAVTPQVLLSWLAHAQVALGTAQLERPGIPLRHSELIVNGPRDLRVGLE